MKSMKPAVFMFGGSAGVWKAFTLIEEHQIFLGSDTKFVLIQVLLIRCRISTCSVQDVLLYIYSFQDILTYG